MTGGIAPVIAFVAGGRVGVVIVSRPEGARLGGRGIIGCSVDFVNYCEIIRLRNDTTYLREEQRENAGGSHE